MYKETYSLPNQHCCPLLFSYCCYCVCVIAAQICKVDQKKSTKHAHPFYFSRLWIIWYLMEMLSFRNVSLFKMICSVGHFNLLFFFLSHHL